MHFMHLPPFFFLFELFGPSFSLSWSRRLHSCDAQPLPRDVLTKDGVAPTGQGGETAHTRSKAADATAAIVISLTAASGRQRPLLTHGPPVERAHEGEDAVVRAAGGLGARNRGHQS